MGIYGDIFREFVGTFCFLIAHSADVCACVCVCVTESTQHDFTQFYMEILQNSQFNKEKIRSERGLNVPVWDFIRRLATTSKSSDKSPN